MKKVYLLVLIFGFLVKFASAQDPNFSQFFFKEAYYNPAFTGINPGLRAEVTDRQFWTAVPGDYRSTQMMIEYYDVKFLNGAFGLNVLSASKGQNFLMNNSVGLQYAKRIGLSRDVLLQLGLSAAFVMQQINYNNLIFSDQLDPRYGNVFQTEFQKPTQNGRSYFDFGAGAVCRFNFMETSSQPFMTNNVGIAFSHLSQPYDGYLPNSPSRLPLKVNLQYYSVIKINRNSFYNSHFLLAPGVIYESQKMASSMLSSDAASFNTLSFGLNAIIPSKLSFMSQLYTGVWMRKQFAKTIMNVTELPTKTQFDALIFMLGIVKHARDGKSNLRISYSYDMTISNATLATGGSHELSIAYEIRNLALPKGGHNWAYVHHPADRFFNIGSGR